MFLRIHPSVIYSLPSCLAFGCELCVFTLICDAPAILKLFCLLFGRAKGKINPAQKQKDLEIFQLKETRNLEAQSRQESEQQQEKTSNCRISSGLMIENSHFNAETERWFFKRVVLKSSVVLFNGFGSHTHTHS